jgi:D-psicose/D-tagatose/L-ribulose 3-epimerase
MEEGGMKYGFNLLLWTGHVTDEHAPLLKALRETGYDSIEVPVFEGTVDDYARLGEQLAALGFDVTAVSVLGAGQNCLSDDAAEREAALDRTKCVRFALEALNRFECYFLNTMEQLAEYLDEVDHPAVKGMYDTFHANIEEKDPVAAIGTISRHMIHVHVSENDRGTPGKGHVPWGATYEALRDAGYDGRLTIEAFGRGVPALAAATRVWRDFFPDEKEVYRSGFTHMARGWADAGADRSGR